MLPCIFSCKIVPPSEISMVPASQSEQIDSREHCLDKFDVPSACEPLINPKPRH